MSQYIAVLRLSDLGRSITPDGRGFGARSMDGGRLGGGGEGRWARPHAEWPDGRGEAEADGAEDGVRPRLLRLAGVESIQVDRVAGSLLVWFNRSQVSLADIVRTLEDAGIAVLGVAQGRADVGEQVKAAIA